MLKIWVVPPDWGENGEFKNVFLSTGFHLPQVTTTKTLFNT